MNYLAHLVLAPREAHAILGALMGDFRKHVNVRELPEEILLGMEHHRAVDKFTDSHPQVRCLKKLFSQNRRRYAGIIIDITFDHFLSRHWHAFSAENRSEFIDYVYGCLRQRWPVMPPRMQHAMHYMLQEDWLGSYVDLAGVENSLNQLSRRIRFQNNLYGAIAEVKDNYPALERGFLEFFPQLIDHVTPGKSAA
ncbi:MAG: hypothetical protein A3J35_03760 [Gammaproteobacteria bacterium RIFCSPLOWO2_02_FULL_52_10]|nr:MAG: hypothetical protein A3J35_03760 [Gammaproteobacteria bacterium RIFCSPLOWO2_02_FULL_52_10]